MQTTLHLIRHGEAYGNVDPSGPVPGMKGDRGLTELGREQAARLRDRLATSGEINADVLLSSPLPRARQTAEIIQPALGLDIGLDPDLEEVRVGEVDGESYETLVRRYGRPGFREHPYKPLSPGGENWAQFILRATLTLERVATEHAGKTVVLVTHGGVIDSSLIAHFSSGTILPPPRLEFDTVNTSITTWVRAGEGTKWYWRLSGYNDCTHARDLIADHRTLWAEAWRKLELIPQDGKSTDE